MRRPLRALHSRSSARTSAGGWSSPRSSNLHSFSLRCASSTQQAISTATRTNPPTCGTCSSMNSSTASRSASQRCPTRSASLPRSRSCSPTSTPRATDSLVCPRSSSASVSPSSPPPARDGSRKTRRASTALAETGTDLAVATHIARVKRAVRAKQEITGHWSPRPPGPADVAAPEDPLLPPTWASCPISTLFWVETGATPLRSRSDYYQGGTVPWVKTGEVQNRDITAAEARIHCAGVAGDQCESLPAGHNPRCHVRGRENEGPGWAASD